MDKYEYKLRADEIKTLIGEGRYAEAVQIADTIDWRKVKSVQMLCTIGDLYKINRRYNESREILLLANARYPDGRYIIYSLCELSIKLQDILRATEYFKEFVRVAPHNTSRYILQYKLYVAQDVSLEERIAVLQEFKKHDYREKWGYELAFLYNRVGLRTECIEECDDLFLWFGGGRYVIKALELKALHEKLSPEQQKVYDRYKASGGEVTAPEPAESAGYDSERDEMGHDEETPKAKEDGEFHVKTVDVGQYNTINLQQVIAESLKELQKKGAAPVPQETRAMESVPAPKQEELASTGDTGILGITEEGLESYEDGTQEAAAEQNRAAAEQAVLSADTRAIGAPVTPRVPVDTAQAIPMVTADGPAPGTPPRPATPDPGRNAVEESLRHATQSIASDDTIWMPGVTEIARYAKKQGIAGDFAQEEAPVPVQEAASEEPVFAQEEINRQVIAQATGEIVLPESVVPVVPVPAEMQQAPEPVPVQREEEPPAADPETEERRVQDEAKKLRAEERRAELRSREKRGRVREVSSDTRRLGQTREYIPVARMDQAVEEALGEPSASGAEHTPVAIPREEIRPAGEEEAAAAPHHNVIRPNRRPDGSAYDNLLAQGADGQISMAVEEGSSTERQITGQISIEELLTGWENYKNARQKQQIEGVKEHVRQNTDELFRSYEEQRQLAEMLEKNDPEGRVREVVKPGPDALEDNPPTLWSSGEETGETAPAAPEDAAAAAAVAAGVAAAAGAAAVAGEAESPADMISPEEPAETEVSPEEKPAEEAPGESGPAAEKEPEETEAAAEGQPGETPEESAKEKTPMSKEEIAHQLAILEGRIDPDTPVEAPTGKADDEELKNAESAGPLPDEEAVREAIQPAEEPSEDGAADKENASADADTEGDEGEDEHVLRVMTPEEKELFGPYIHRKRSRKQIIQAIDSLSLAPYTGNVIITGEEGAGTINLAKGLIRSVQLSDANFSGQIAKISGRAMNRKRVDAIVDKLTGGALIIQGASSMNNETTKALLKALESENKGIIVVLEDTRKGIEKYLKKHPEITECFNVRVDVEALATRELVAYAKQYALDKEYSMDEFAMLALHKRIDEMQTAEHEVTIAEVRDLVDEAISRATRKNPSHFFDILLQKRYDEEDMIILREKDFLR